MDNSFELLEGIANFYIYFGTSIALLILFKFSYTLITPLDEWKLVKEENNTAAAIGLAGAVVGFCIAIAGAASNSVSIIDYLIWSAIALVSQLIAYALVRIIFMPKITTRIQNGEIPAAIVLASTAIGVGVLNAACMTY